MKLTEKLRGLSMQIAVIYSLGLERLCQAFRGLNEPHEPKGGGETKP